VKLDELASFKEIMHIKITVNDKYYSDENIN